MGKLAILRTAAKAGVKGAGVFFLILALGILINWIFLWQFIYASDLPRLWSWIGWILFGIALPVASGVVAYQSAIRSTLTHVYENTVHLWVDGVADWIAEKVESPDDASETGSPKANELDPDSFRARLSSRAESLPGFMKWGFFKILEQIPVVNILSDVSQDFVSGDPGEAASAKVFKGIDEFVRGTVLGIGATLSKLLIPIHLILFALFWWLSKS